jgi:hypothetical protein
MATRLTRATLAGLPPPFFLRLAGIAAEKRVGSHRHYFKVRGSSFSLAAGFRDASGHRITEFGTNALPTWRPSVILLTFQHPEHESLG